MRVKDADRVLPPGALSEAPAPLTIVEAPANTPETAPQGTAWHLLQTDAPPNPGKYQEARQRLIRDHIDVTEYVVREIDGLSAAS